MGHICQMESLRRLSPIDYITDRTGLTSILAEIAEKAGAEVRKNCRQKSPSSPLIKGEIGGIISVEVIEGDKRYSHGDKDNYRRRWSVVHGRQMDWR